MVAIADACASGEIPGELVRVISNVPGAGALEFAAERGIACQTISHRDYESREAFEEALLADLAKCQPDLVVLAGFMRILTERFIREYYGSLLNIHPSLLPKYPGLNTHQRALDAGDREAGSTVHFVTPELDAGPIIDQARVPVLANDTAESLAARVQQAEHALYPRAIARCVEGAVRLGNGRAESGPGAP